MKSELVWKNVGGLGSDPCNKIPGRERDLACPSRHTLWDFKRRPRQNLMRQVKTSNCILNQIEPSSSWKLSLEFGKSCKSLMSGYKISEPKSSSSLLNSLCRPSMSISRLTLDCDDGCLLQWCWDTGGCPSVCLDVQVSRQTPNV